MVSISLYKVFMSVRLHCDTRHRSAHSRNHPIWDLWDVSPQTLEIMRIKCIWSPATFATIFVTFRWAPWEAKFKGETKRKSSEVNG